jgi:hypothetical protein
MSRILEHAIGGCLLSAMRLPSSKLVTTDTCQGGEQGFEILPQAPASPVSTMDDVVFLVASSDDSYKEVIDYCPTKTAYLYHQKRTQLFVRRNDRERMKLYLDSIFDKKGDSLLSTTDDASIEMEWSDDEDDEPRGLSFIMDDCMGADCSMFSCNPSSSALSMEDEEAPK